MLRLFLIFAFTFQTTSGFSQCQMELEISAGESYQRTHRSMKKLYFEILHEYRNDTIFVQNLKKSQHIWLYYRNAMVKARYPDPIESNVIYLCIFLYLEELTQDRIKALMVWKKGIKEGDVCAGSVNVY
jgi:uncharacterized protein YecT (DUF1311 family)